MADRAVTRMFGAGRVTATRSIIARTVKGMPRAFTAEDLADAVRGKAGSSAPSLATVYRALAAMEATGSIERVGTRTGSALFATCEAHSHHHHIVCDRCGKTAHAECPVIDTTPRPDGFVVTRHEVMLYGICADCASKEVRD